MPHKAVCALALGFAMLSACRAWPQAEHLKMPQPEAKPADSITPSPAQPHASPVPLGLWDYQGMLDGTQRVHFTLVATQDGTITGSYFLFSDLKSLTFEGRTIDATSFSARVAVSQSTANASRYLYLKTGSSSTGSPQPDTLTGALYGNGGSIQHALTLTLVSGSPTVASEADRYRIAGAQDAATVEQNAQQFLAAVLASQPAVAANYVAYPLAYTENGKRSLLHTPAEFVQKFPTVFTAAFVDKLRLAPAKAMSANRQGILLGDGAVWFDSSGKAFALNNDSIRMFTAKRFLSNAGWAQHSSHPSTTAQPAPASGSSRQPSSQRRKRRRSASSGPPQ